MFCTFIRRSRDLQATIRATRANSLDEARIDACRTFIKDVVLATDTPTALAQRVQEKALWLANQEQRKGRNNVRFEPRTAAFAKSDLTTVESFPNGAPSMELYIRRD